jgi:3-oxoacyl-[acyl-carrier protein] reductase
MLLERKNAVIYGGGGNIGGAVARAFAREGATVHLAGRTLAKLEQVAGEIRQHGGTATVAQVDALDERVVDAHANELVRDHGTLDISMNLISTGDVQGTPLVEMEVADFERPIHDAMCSTYVTARAAGRHIGDEISSVGSDVAMSSPGPASKGSAWTTPDWSRASIFPPDSLRPGS